MVSAKDINDLNPFVQLSFSVRELNGQLVMVTMTWIGADKIVEERTFKERKRAISRAWPQLVDFYIQVQFPIMHKLVMINK